MLTGKEPFQAVDKNEVIFNIISSELELESLDISEEAKDIINKLTQKILELRLGSGEKNTQQHISELLNHPWFTDIDEKGEKQKIDFDSVTSRHITLD